MNIIKVQKYVYNNIKQGFYDMKKKLHSTSIKAQAELRDYYLQTKDELYYSNIGLSFDIVELYREACRELGIEFHSYFLEYAEENYYAAKSVGIIKTKRGYVELIDNTYDKFVVNNSYKKLSDLTKAIYKKFQQQIREDIKNPKGLYYYFNEYPKPHKSKLIDSLKDKEYYGETRNEVSAMSVVFCKNKILCLKDKDEKIILPKGHIEGDESSLATAIRECKEETGVVITENDHIKEVMGYDYIFSGANLKYMTNKEFKDVFNTNAIHKTIKAHYFEIEAERSIDVTEEDVFIDAKFMDIDEFLKRIAYENTKRLVIQILNIREIAKK